MMNKIINIFISLVWIINGLYCKILNGVPRHERIVREITGLSWSNELTIMIGFLEVGMAVWILSGYLRKMNMVLQVLVVMTMNLLEFFLVPDLLLWGRLNIVFALGFVLIVLANYHNQTANRNVR